MSLSILASLSNISRIMFDSMLTSALGFVSFQAILIFGIVEEICFLYAYG